MVNLRAAGIIIYRMVNDVKPEILLLQTAYNKEWAPPKGHVDPGESDLDTAFRETKEEAGISKCDISIHNDFKKELHYVIKKSVYVEDVNKQKTSVYFLGKVNGNQDVTLSEEHISYKWVTFEDAISTVKFENYATLYSSAQSYLSSTMTSNK